MDNVIYKDNVIYRFSKDNAPVLSVDSGAIVKFHTLDCFGEQIDTKCPVLEDLDWERINPATGPIYVNGAEIGDSLKITIEKIAVASTAIVSTGRGMGLFGDQFEEVYVKVLDIKDNMLIFKDLSIPIKPMIGVIGVAPSSESISCGVPGTHGGNMDNNMITEGSTLYLPVLTKGALFACGDVHAVMGDGEVCVTGAEVSSEVTVKLELIKNKSLANPVLENDDYIITIASDEILDVAVETSVGDMLELLLNTTNKFNKEELVMLFSLVGNTEICQIVDPKKTARFKFPKAVLK